MNEGVSGTDSAFGIARINENIIQNNVDLVILEFAMNDQWLDSKVRKRTYEGVVRKIMNNTETAILALFVNERKPPYPSNQAEITFEVEGKSVGVTYCESDKFRNCLAWVTKDDGTSSGKVTIECYSSYRNGYCGWAYRELVSGNTTEKYTVHVQLSNRAAKNSQGKYGNITGILVQK